MLLLPFLFRLYSFFNKKRVSTEKSKNLKQMPYIKIEGEPTSEMSTWNNHSASVFTPATHLFGGAPSATNAWIACFKDATKQ